MAGSRRRVGIRTLQAMAVSLGARKHHMVDLATEKEHLAKADRDIAEGETRVARQAELIEHMRTGSGHGVWEAERLLETLKGTLQAWRDHRSAILRTIAGMEKGALPAEPASGSSD